MTPRVHAIAERIATAYVKLEGVRLRHPIHVVEDESAPPFEAFAVANHIFLFTKLHRLEDDELAFILAHELGHIHHGDCDEAIARLEMGLVGAIWNGVRGRVRSQSNERRADEFARRLVVAAGYVDASPHLFKRMLGRDHRSEIRWNALRRVPLVGGLLDRLRAAREQFTQSHPYTERRLELALESARDAETSWRPTRSGVCVAVPARCALEPMSRPPLRTEDFW